MIFQVMIELLFYSSFNLKILFKCDCFSYLDFIIGDENATVVAWRLLEALLLKYEEPKLTTLHAAVACKIMSLDISLPYWLEVSYKVNGYLYFSICVINI